MGSRTEKISLVLASVMAFQSLLVNFREELPKASTPVTSFSQFFSSANVYSFKNFCPLFTVILFNFQKLGQFHDPFTAKLTFEIFSDLFGILQLFLMLFAVTIATFLIHAQRYVNLNMIGLPKFLHNYLQSKKLLLETNDFVFAFNTYRFFSRKNRQGPRNT